MEELQSKVESLYLFLALLFLLGFGAAAFFIASLNRIVKRLDATKEYTSATRKMVVESVSSYERSVAGMKEHYKDMKKLAESQHTINTRTVSGLEGLYGVVNTLGQSVDDLMDYVTDTTEANDPYVVSVMQGNDLVVAYSTHDLETPVSEVLADTETVVRDSGLESVPEVEAVKSAVDVQKSLLSRAADMLNGKGQ